VAHPLFRFELVMVHLLRCPVRGRSRWSAEFESCQVLVARVGSALESCQASHTYDVERQLTGEP
jgi:hypothetical protein